MDSNDVIRAHEERLLRLEKSVESLSLSFGETKYKANGAWKSIQEINGRMEKIEERMKSLEADMKTVKSEQQSIGKSVKALIVMVAIIGVISIGFFVYIWRHDADLAKSILSLGTTIGNIIV